MITREDIRELAQFQYNDEDNCVLSFYFQPRRPQNKSHREEAILAKDLVREALHGTEKNAKNKCAKADLQRIQIVTFVKTLDEFLRDGTEAAIRSVDAFSELGVKGFQIGTERFEGRNEAVMRGDNLSQRLRRTIEDPELLSVIESRQTLRDVVIDLGRRFRNGRRLGRSR